jgi:hypothetical protein
MAKPVRSAEKTAERLETHRAGGDPAFAEWAEGGDWKNVQSSNVAAIAYDADKSMIKVRYKNGAEWGYFPYPPASARDFFHAGSYGTWVNDHIKVRGAGNAKKHQKNATRLN